MAGLLLLGDDLGDGDQDLDGEKADAVLIILNKVLEEGYHFVDDDSSGHLLDELGQVGGSLPANHRGVIVNKETELLAELLLDGRRNLFVGSREEAAARDFGCEPVGLGEANGEWDEVLLDLLR